MPFLRPSVLQQPARRLATSIIPQRSISLTARLRIKEGAHRTPEELEATKQEHLSKQKQGKGEWDEALASHGEANVKADKEHVQDHDKHIEDLQKETAKKSQRGKA